MSCRRADHQADGLSGEGGGLSAPGASAEAAPSRVRTLPGAAADAGRLSPLPAGRWWPAVTWVSGTAVSRSVRVPVQRCRRLFRRERPPSRALPPVASSRRKTRAP